MLKDYIFGFKATSKEKYKAYRSVEEDFLVNKKNKKWDKPYVIEKINISDVEVRDEFKYLETFINKSRNQDVYFYKFLNPEFMFQFGSTLKGTNIVIVDNNKANYYQELFHIIYHLEETIPGINNDNLNIVETWSDADGLYLKQLLDGRISRRIRRNNSPHDVKFLDYVFLRAYIGKAFSKDDDSLCYHSAFSLIEPTIKLLMSCIDGDIKHKNKVIIDAICFDKVDDLKEAFNKKFGENAYEKVFFDFNLFNRLKTIKSLCKNEEEYEKVLNIMFSPTPLVPTVIGSDVVRYIWENDNVNQDKDFIINLIENHSKIAQDNKEKINMNNIDKYILGAKKMKILLCYPTVSEEYDKIRDAGLTPHLSLLCIASHIKDKFDDLDIDIVDGHHESYDEICEKIKNNNYDVIGFSIDFTNYITSVKLANFAKRVNPNVKIGCGSNHASNMYNQILNNQPSYDFIGINDGEEQFENYIRYLKGEISISEVPNLAYRVNDKVVVNPIRTFDLKKMVSVDYEQVDLDKYFEVQKKIMGEDFKMLQFTSQRGCANHPLCVFCGRYDDGMRFRDPKEYAKEVAFYTEKYELTEVWDRSDSFIQNVAWLKEFANELNKLTDRFTTGKTTFKTYSRADQLLRQDVIDILKSLNFRMVFIGYEAGDDRILKNIGKHANLDTYYKATKNVLDNGIDIDASFIVGLPGENKESLNNHVKFVKKLIEMGLDKIRVNRLLVLPGTPIYREIVKKYPEIAKKDIVPMEDLQRLVFTTDLYDLGDFNNSVDTFIEEITKTAGVMTNLVKENYGVFEGYGHGKGNNMLEGDELALKKIVGKVL